MNGRGADERRVQALLGSAALAPLVDRLVQRVRLGRPLTGKVALTGLEPAQQAAVAALLGRSVGRASSTSVPLAEVERVVQGSGAAPDLAAALAMLRGPIGVAQEEAERERAEWDAVLAPLESFVGLRPEFAVLPAVLRRTGALKAGGRSAEEAAHLITDLVAVLGALPTSGETLAAFSARVLHRAHGLDIGPLRALVELALGFWFGDDAGEEDASGEERFVGRWSRAGIAFDTLASSVLVHGLRFDAGEPVGAALDALAATGQPVLVTLRMLLAGARPVADEVFVCENPAVLIAAADRFGTASAPLVCVRGQPSVATRRLLRSLADSGAVLRYHGDFDWGGIRIANRLVERYGVLPWRFGIAALAAGAHLPGDALAGERVEAVWDAGLAEAIEARASRLEEEQVLSALLQDLARGPAGR